jgi:hypothetical protein
MPSNLKGRFRPKAVISILPSYDCKEAKAELEKMQKTHLIEVYELIATIGIDRMTRDTTKTWFWEWL